MNVRRWIATLIEQAEQEAAREPAAPPTDPRVLVLRALATYHERRAIRRTWVRIALTLVGLGALAWWIAWSGGR